MVVPTEYLTREQAADYLNSIGYPIKKRTLDKLAEDDNSGRGPPFTRTGWRTVRYERSDLDIWASKRKQKVP